MANKKHCMFQYATGGRFIDTTIHEDTDLITWEDAVRLWKKYEPQFISELESGLMPEMVIWTDCEDNVSYINDTFHVDHRTQIKDGKLVQIIVKTIDPSKAPVF